MISSDFTQFLKKYPNMTMSISSSLETDVVIISPWDPFEAESDTYGYYTYIHGYGISRSPDFLSFEMKSSTRQITVIDLVARNIIAESNEVIAKLEKNPFKEIKDLKNWPTILFNDKSQLIEHVEKTYNGYIKPLLPPTTLSDKCSVL